MKDNSIALYQSDDGNVVFDVTMDNETVWLTQKQMAELFDKNKRTISEHIGNVFAEGELDKKAVVRNFRTTATDGKVYDTAYYNLDVIISVGYRVKSKRGTQFRIWATAVLKNHLIQGYTINEKRIKHQNQKLLDLQKTVHILQRTVENQNVELMEAKGLLKVISEYTYALTLLDEYDHQNVAVRHTTQKVAYRLEYEEAMKVILSMKDEFSSPLFGNEKDESFKGTLGAIYQTAFGDEVYPSIEEKAANLLYFIVKNHSFSDGNKRIAAAIFIYFMNKNGVLYRADGSKRIADNSLVAMILMIAESRPQEKEIIVKVVINLINSNN